MEIIAARRRHGIEEFMPARFPRVFVAFAATVNRQYACICFRSIRTPLDIEMQDEEIAPCRKLLQRGAKRSKCARKYSEDLAAHDAVAIVRLDVHWCTERCAV